MPHWLLHLGVFGVLGVSFLDSSPFVLPVPGSTDLLILIFAAHRQNPFLLALAGVLGSVLGGYLTWVTGKKGGEAMLDRYLRKRMRARVERWTRKHASYSVFLAALLPPPIPLLPFLLASGALGASRRQLLVSLTLARTLRYGAEAALGAIYGRMILHLWARYLSSTASTVILWIFIAILLGGIAFGVWQFWRQRRTTAPNTVKTAA